jgi:hypothetical protein
MPFIGQQPITGAYSKLDAITTSATATYNLLLNGGAYSPASANHLLVSLNGVMQAPQDSFTVSGSTIIFDSALTSSDNIDFIMALGDVLNIGTPSDGTVTAAKITNGAVTDAKIATGITASKLTGALPAISGAALTGISSVAGTCSFTADMGSAQNISQNTWTKLPFNTEETDPDNCFNTTTYEFTAPANGQYFFHGKCQINNLTSQQDLIYFRIYVNDAQPSGDATESVTGGYATSAHNEQFITVSGVLNLSANDEVSLYVYTTAGSRTIPAKSSCFSGFRLV